MQKPKDMTALQWLAPSMVRDGLLKNGDWVLPAADEAAKMFADTDLHLPAQFLAVLNRFALDYIKQAPVLVAAATRGRKLLRREDRLEIGRRFIAACESGTKLGALLQSYGLAPQLRALSANAVSPDQCNLLETLSAMVPASPLSQAIPKLSDEQRYWLMGLEGWRVHMARHFRNRDLLLDWAAVNIRDDRARRCASDVADFAGRNRERFNPDWSFQQAHAAAQRWHGELALHRPVIEASRPDWRTVIDYGPLPAHFEADDIAFHALQTREALHLEGARMHHCVRLYTEKVAHGSSRIYSVLQGGLPIATLELLRTTRSGASTHKFRLVQLKGPRNSNPAAAVWNAAEVFIATVNNAPLPNGPAQPVAQEQGSRTIAALRSRLGDEVFSAWFGNFMWIETFDGAVLSVSFPTRFLKRWVETHFLDTLLACAGAEFPGVECIEVRLRVTDLLPDRPANQGVVRPQWV